MKKIKLSGKSKNPIGNLGHWAHPKGAKSPGQLQKARSVLNKRTVKDIVKDMKS